MNVYDELRSAVFRLTQIDGRGGHGSHRGEHAPARCRQCRDWTLAVLYVWREADRIYGPLGVAHAVIKELERLP